MKATNILFLCSICSLLFISCGDKSVDTPIKSNFVENGVTSSSAFTLSISTQFNNLSSNERAYGSFGVLYCEAGVESEQLFKQWADGNDDAVKSNRLNIKRTTALLPGYRIEMTIDGLTPDTPYSVCCFFESEDGTTRRIGAVEQLSTKKFQIELSNTGAQNVKYFSALLKASVSGLDSIDRQYCSAGFVISEEQDPTIENGTTLRLNGTVTKDDFEHQIRELKTKTQYNFRPFIVINTNEQYFYGETDSFSTLDYDENIVDMGTSVLWSRLLLGAEDDHTEGDLYRWGEVNPAKEGVPYKGVELNGEDINISGSEYDPVTYKLGGKWRMPSSQELKELAEACRFSGKTMKDPLDNYLEAKSIKTGEIINIPQTRHGFFKGDNPSHFVVNDSEGRFILWSSDMRAKATSFSTYVTVDAYLREEIENSPSFDGKMSTLIEAGCVKEVIHTNTSYNVEVFKPNNYMDNMSAYNSGSAKLNDGEWLIISEQTVLLNYLYQILPVCDRD